MSGARPAAVRFYVDADVLGLAHVISKLRSDVTYPGDPGAVFNRRRRPPCVITSPAVKDPVWIPQVAQQGWLIITRDRRIQEHRAEIQAVRDAGAKMVTLASADAGSTWAQLEVLMSQWRHIEALTARDGPFIWTASRTVTREIPLA